MLDRVSNWQDYLAEGLDDATVQTLRKHSNTGHLLGDEPFLEMLESKLRKVLRPLKQGRKRKIDK